MFDIDISLEKIAAVVELSKFGIECGGQVKDWLTGKLDARIEAQIRAAISALPDNSPFDEIGEAIRPIFNSARGIGGGVSYSAGSNGGGNVHLDNVAVKAGSGTNKGGDLTFKAGDGGPNGNGGDLIITGGNYTAGDATV
ncbi:MAG TPA: hypothetical protein VF472_20525 [Burkholderiaceae bacterium]